MKRTLVLGAVLAASIGGIAPAQAQLYPLTDPLPRTLGEPIDRRLDRVEQTLREMRAILFQGRETGRPVVVQPAETQGQLEIMNRRVTDLQDTLTRINNQLDTLATDIAAVRRQATSDANASRAQAQALAQLTGRLDGLERQVTALTEAERLRNEDPAVAFDRAMQLFVDGRIVQAGESFQLFVNAHPDDERAPEARYYLGEAMFRQANYLEAARSYLAATRGWPDTPWAPDATVKLALALIETGRDEEACAILGDFSSQYEDAPQPVRQQADSARNRARC